jgi:hypothetical protein
MFGILGIFIQIPYLMDHLVYFYFVHRVFGDRGSTVVKALRYKSEGRWFDSRWCH